MAQNKVGNGQVSNDDIQKFNTYATKKTFATGLLDISLLMANASQLKVLCDLGPSKHDYFSGVVFLIALSITVQVFAAVLMLVLGRMVGKTEEERRRVNIVNDVIVGLIVLVTMVNIFISAFGIQTGEFETVYNQLNNTFSR